MTNLRRRRHGRTGLAAGVAVVALALACQESAAPPARPSPVAPARAAATGPTCPGNGAHGKHVQDLALACALCHPSGAQYGFTDANAVTYPRGTTTKGGVIVLGDASATPPTPTTCSVGCHSPLGAPAHTVAWTDPGPLACTACHDTSTLPQAHPAVSPTMTRADCQGCHQTAGHTSGTVTLVGHDATTWMSQTSPGFHAFSANLGLSRCEACHAQDLTGGVTGVSCGSCHDVTNASTGIVASWKTNCTMCHGGAEDLTGGPPKAIWGQASDPVRTGAHTSHVTASALSPAIACSACHATPADAFSAGHIDEITDPAAVPTATVTFGGLSTLGGAAPTWTRSSATCASTYCHGATLPGGSNTSPSWTKLDGTQAACGTCHGLPPAATHPGVSAAQGLAACNGCHPNTVDAAGALIPATSGGKHLDGIVEAQGHPAAWMDQANAGFHAYAANVGLDACKSCHGQDLSGGSAGTGCGSCHDQALPAGVASWRTNCTMCHGGTDNKTGAPPRTTWGKSTDAIRTGAHTLHVAKAVACAACHVMPADALAAGHVDAATATVSFAGLALTGIGPAAAQPSWSRASATCASTYCHGNFKNGNATYAPSWVAPAANACGTCHGLPPGGTHPQNSACGSCHDGYSASTVNAALHLNGTVDVKGLTCTSCHGDSTRAATTLNPQLAAAPPSDTLGNVAASAPGVGAHTLHLTSGITGNAMACTECHVVPTSTVHANGVDDVAFGPLATATGTLTPTWNPATLTCSGTYCHGSFRSGNAAYAPVWNAPNPNPCGTCHGTPPTTGGHTGSTDCGSCHPGYTQTAVNTATHLNGKLDVNASSCTACHGDPTRAATALNPQLPAAPPMDLSGGTASSSPGVGAHQAHLNAGSMSGAFACTECHAVPADLSAHPNGRLDLSWGPIASTGGVTPTFNGTSCTNYCHGNYSGIYTYQVYDWGSDSLVPVSVPYAGKAASPAWTGATPACDGCHGNPPAATGVWHSGSHGYANGVDYNGCQVCHPDAATTNGVNAIADPTLHVNGVVDVAAQFRSVCFNCH